MTRATGETFGKVLMAGLAQKDRIVGEHLAGVGAAVKDQFVTAWLERAEQELAPIAAARLKELLEYDGLPDALREGIERAIGPQNQTDFLLNILLTGFSAVFQLGALTSPFAQKILNQLWSEHLQVPLSADQAAVAVLKGIWSPATGASEAAFTGYSAANFGVLTELIGDPPGPAELLAMRRRNIIDDATLDHGIRQSRVRDEWIPSLHKFMFGPPSAAAAISAAVQGHLDDTSAQTIVEQNGIDGTYYPWLLQTAGRPPGAEQMLHLWNRGLVAQADVEAAIRESDIKNKYIPAILHLREYLPPVRTVVAMRRHGAIDDARFTTLLDENGVRAQDIAGYLAEAHHTTSAAQREVGIGMIRTAYADGALTNAAATAHLVTLGYAAADATLILDLTDAHAEHQVTMQAVTRVRSLYIGGHLTRADTSADLDQLGIAATQRDRLLRTWDIERRTVSKTLTLAQLQAAWKKGYVTEAALGTRIETLGYSPADADILVSLAITKPSVAQITKAYQMNIYSEAQYRQALTDRGYRGADIDTLVTEANGAIPTPPAA